MRLNWTWLLAPIAAGAIACSSSKTTSPCEDAAEKRIELEVAALPEAIRAEHAETLRRTAGYRLRRACEAKPEVAKCLKSATTREAAADCLAKAGIDETHATADQARR